MRAALLVVLSVFLIGATPPVEFSVELHVTSTVGNRLNDGTGATISVMLDDSDETSAQFVVEWGTTPITLSNREALQTATDDTRVDFLLTGLPQGAQTCYRVNSKPVEDVHWGMGAVNCFTTARATGAEFKMAFVTDSHIYQGWANANCGDSTDDDYFKLEFFQQTISNVRSAGVDFVLFGGDEWHQHCLNCDECNVDGVSAGEDTIDDATEAELRLRQWSRLVAGLLADIPFHISLGNHDGECSWGNDTAVRDCGHWDGLDARAQAARLKYWVNPDTAYSAANGSANGDYYAFMPSEDVEIFVLTPHKYGVSGAVHPDDYPGGADQDDPDTHTLGAVQAAWLATELGNSTATWRLIAIHNLPGAAYGRSTRCYWYSRGDVLASQDGTVDTDILGVNAQALHAAADAGSAHILAAHDHLAWTAQKDDVLYIRGGRSASPATNPLTGAVTPAWAAFEEVIAVYDLDGNGTADYDEIGGSNHASREGGFMLFTFDGTTSMSWEYRKTDPDDPAVNNTPDFRCTITSAATPDLTCVDL